MVPASAKFQSDRTARRGRIGAIFKTHVCAMNKGPFHELVLALNLMAVGRFMED